MAISGDLYPHQPCVAILLLPVSPSAKVIYSFYPPDIMTRPSKPGALILYPQGRVTNCKRKDLNNTDKNKLKEALHQQLLYRTFCKTLSRKATIEYSHSQTNKHLRLSHKRRYMHGIFKVSALQFVHY